MTSLVIPKFYTIDDLLDMAPETRRALLRTESEKAINTLFEADQVIELRKIGERGVTVGYYDSDHRENMIREAHDTTTFEGGIIGSYMTIQRLNPAVLARRANRSARPVPPLFIGKGSQGSDVESYRWFILDLDPKRPGGISSTADELLEAHAHALLIRETLMGEGWPAPIWANSGNGAHLLWRLNVVLDADHTIGSTMVRKLMILLSERFSTPRVSIDRYVYDPARCIRFYGTLARKGDNLTSRPYRMSNIIHVPDEIKVGSFYVKDAPDIRWI